ncbi:MAG: hypothetical protein U0798_00930 [Gemmataceae bacterium]
MSAPSMKMPDLPPLPQGVPELADLLRQSIDLQKRQIQIAQAMYAQHDASPKWKSLLTRWSDDFPTIGQDCKKVLPAVERAFLNLMQQVTQRLEEADVDELENDFTLGEFLDRYGTKLAQLAGIMNQLTPLADNAPPVEPPPPPKAAE